MVNVGLHIGANTLPSPPNLRDASLSSRADVSTREGLVTIHDVRQALNVLRITAGNIGVRLKPVLDEADSAYLDRRLEVIDNQVQALAEMAEVLCAMSGGGCTRAAR